MFKSLSPFLMTLSLVLGLGLIHPLFADDTPWIWKTKAVLEDDELLNFQNRAYVQDSLAKLEADSNSKATELKQNAENKSLPNAQSSALEAPKKDVFVGLATASDSKKPLQKVDVLFESNGKIWSATSDENGLFKIYGLKVGQIYKIKLQKKGYSTFEQNEFNLEQISGVREFQIDKRVLTGQSITVQKPQRGNTAAGMMAQRQKNAGVMEGVSAEQIAKSTDSDAGAIARRVTGTSVVGGKYVYVRGLGERYTNMTLNGLPVPTPEKDKRVVPQDLFPASSLESFAIYKTFSPELPADFAGGSVALETKGLPDKNFFKVSYGIGSQASYKEGYWTTVGRDRLTYDGGDGISNYFGYDDGTRALPEGVPSKVTSQLYTKEQIAEIARKFNNKMAVDTASILPNQNLGIQWANIYKNPDNSKFGFLAGLTFKNKYDQDQTRKYSFEQGGVTNAKGQTLYDTVSYLDTVSNTTKTKLMPLIFTNPSKQRDISTGSYNTTLSALFNAGYEDQNNKLWLKSLYANLSEDKTVWTVVQETPTASEQTFTVDDRQTLEFSRRSIFVNQIGGGHYIGKNVLDSLSWAAGWASAYGETPDQRINRFFRTFNTVGIKKDTTIQGVAYRAGDTARVYDALTFSPGGEYAARFFDVFEEQAWSGRMDFYFVIPPEISEADTLLKSNSFFHHLALPTAKAGWMWSAKSRSYDLTRFDYAGLYYKLDPSLGYDMINQIYNPDSVANSVLKNGQGFKTTPKDYDSYKADEYDLSYYLSAQESFYLGKYPIDLQAGVRLENFWQILTVDYTGEAYKDNQAKRDSLNKKIHNSEFEYYPSFSASIEVAKGQKLRFLYSSTLVRPEIRELAPTSYYDYDLDYVVVGNPELKNTQIQHFDFRFDSFLPYNQIFSLSLFYKNFDKPIENYIDANATPNSRRVQNALEAYCEGIETEIDLKLNRVLQTEALQGLSLYANATWVWSEVQLDPAANGTSLLTNKKRSMIGQSPWLYNLKLTHETEGKSNWLNALLFNVAGERILTLGTMGIGDVYEMPFYGLDYLSKWTYSKHSVGFKIKNLLEQSQVTRIADGNRSKTYSSYNSAQIEQLYASHPAYFEFKKAVGLGYELSYTYDF